MFNIETMLSSSNTVLALIIIAGLIFAECAFLFGLFVPGGDILLLACGVFAAEGNLPLAGVLIVVFIAAVAGYEVGYYIGQTTGTRIFTQKKNSVFFRKEYAERTHGFYKKHGAKTIVIARFVAYVRTVAPLLAGVAGMKRSRFVFYNIAGSLLWTLSLVMIGYWFGSAFTEQIKQYIFPVTVIGIVLMSLIMVIHWFIMVKRTS